MLHRIQINLNVWRRCLVFIEPGCAHAALQLLKRSINLSIRRQRIERYADYQSIGERVRYRIAQWLYENPHPVIAVLRRRRVSINTFKQRRSRANPPAIYSHISAGWPGFLIGRLYGKVRYSLDERRGPELFPIVDLDRSWRKHDRYLQKDRNGPYVLEGSQSL